MVAIKDKKIPKSCWNCNFCCNKNGYYCVISHNLLAREVAYIPSENRPSDCPLVEIVTCKDCGKIEDAIIVPEGATNGDVVMTMFPNLKGKEKAFEIEVNVNKNKIGNVSTEWWNTQYKKGENE